ncbi:MAG: Poxvirus G6 [Methyloprofundus sp.]|nr:Poxvirus G6 [Methyloprofundus sp.]
MCKHTQLIITLLAIIFLTSGCSKSRLSLQNNAAKLDACQEKIYALHNNHKILNQALDTEIFHYQEIIEELLVNREKSLGLLSHYDKNTVLPPATLDAMNLHMQSALQTMDKVSEFIDNNQCWQTDASNSMQELLSLDPTLRLKGVMLALSGRLMLYDSYLTVITLINEYPKVRRFLNQSDMGYGIQEDQLATMTDDFLSVSSLSNIENSIAYYRHSKKLIPTDTIADENFAYLDLLIHSSHSYAILSDLSVSNIIAHRFNSRSQAVEDSFNAFNRIAINSISELFGNTVGLIEDRKGRMYQDRAAEKKVLTHLQAGDILLEKTPFRLTDRMIPGYWGHAAIWLGNEQELKALGLWDTPLVHKYQTQIQNQQLVVEALRDGTQMNSLSHFLNIDDLVILRRKNLSEQNKKKIITLALRQVGKPYDFNYDVETTDKIVCSQLVYLAYTGIEWPTDNFIGRYTISPDQIAQKALLEGVLEPILLFIDGKLIAQDSSAFVQTLQKQ